MDSEDMYAGFETNPEAASSAWGLAGGMTANPLMSGAPPPTAGGGIGANPLLQAPPSQWGRGVIGSNRGLPPGTAFGARPMTSNRPVGFTSGGGGPFDPLQQGRSTLNLGPAPPLKKRSENSPEEQCLEMEKAVNRLLEESAMLALRRDFDASLEKAKEAGKKEKQLCKQRETLNLGDQINADLTYAVQFNLAVQYQNRQLYTEALSTYNLIIQNQQFPQAACLRVNVGNIYAEQKKYLLAIKMYRSTLDETPATSKELRYKLLRNIGNAFVKMGQYRDAVSNYEAILEGNRDIDAGFNLLLCYYTLGEIEKVKKVFQRMLDCRPAELNDDDDLEEEEQKKDVLVDDALRKQLKERREHFLDCIMTAARLIAPILDKNDWRTGYDYLIERLRHYEMHDSNAHVSSELEMCKCLNYLKYKRYKDAIDGLKAFEKKDKLLRCRAATNLAYLYFLEGDYENGEKYSDLSIEADRYNAKALVNKGNFMFVKGEYEQARENYNAALAVEADNMEAIYNLGLTAKQLGLYEEALKMFKRVQSLVDSAEVVYQIADLNDLMGDNSSLEWFNRLIGRVPTDPNALARVGSLYAREGDESQAFHYYLEAYRYYQVNMDVITWLGAYFVKNEIYDKALQVFDRAVQIQPQEVKWPLMMASCHRRRGDLVQAKRQYEVVHRQFSDNIECVKCLVQLCKEAGAMEESNEWYKKMKKMEERQEMLDENEPTEKEESTFASRRRGSGDHPAKEEVIEEKSAEKRNQKVEEDDLDIELPGV